MLYLVIVDDWCLDDPSHVASIKVFKKYDSYIHTLPVNIQVNSDTEPMSGDIVASKL